MRTRRIGIASALLLCGTTALADIVATGPFWIPGPPVFLNAVPNETFWQDLNAANEGVGWCFRVPKTGTLDKVEYRIGAVGNVPDNGHRVSFQNSSGDFPDGTQDQFRDVTSGFTSNAWITPGLMTSDGTDGGVKRSVTVGDHLCVVVEDVAFTAGDSVNFNGLAIVGSTLLSQPVSGQNYSVSRNSSSVWTVHSSTSPMTALKYDDGTYVHISPSWVPIVTFTTHTFANTSTPDERGLRFQVPISMRLTGVWFRGDNTAALDVVLYDSVSTAVATVSVDSAIDSQTGGLNFAVPFAPTTLTANSTYRIAIKPTSTSNVTLYSITAPGNDYLQALEGGDGWYYTSRTDAGAWTDDDTSRPWIGLQFNGIDSGGGEQSHPFIAQYRGQVLPFVARRQSRPTLDWTHLLQAAAR